MKRYLTLSLEIISLFTALGIVISTFLYSIQFTSFDLNYLAVASISDILRDSLKLLIIYIASAVAVPVSMALLFIKAPKKRIFRLGAGLAGAAAFAAMILFLRFTGYAVGGAKPKPLPTIAEGWIEYTAVGILLIILFSNAIFPPRQSRNWNFSERISSSDLLSKVILVIIIFALVIFPISVSMRTIGRQMDRGLLMDFDLGDVKGCDDLKGYSVVWIGDNRAVVRCKLTKRVVVKVLK